MFLTRLHVRYDDAHFPEDLVFQETADRTNFQGRYVLRHAVDRRRDRATAAAELSPQRSAERHEQEAQRLAVADRLDRRRRSGRRWGSVDRPLVAAGRWWERIWKN